MPIFATSPGWTVVAGKRTEGLGRWVYAGRIRMQGSAERRSLRLCTLPVRLPAMPHTRPTSTCIDPRSSHATRGARWTLTKNPFAHVERVERMGTDGPIRSGSRTDTADPARARPYSDIPQSVAPAPELRRTRTGMAKARTDHNQSAPPKEESTTQSARERTQITRARRYHSLLQLQTHVGQNATDTNRPSLVARSKGSETVRPKWRPISAYRPRRRRDRSDDPSKVELGCKSQIGERTGQSLPNYA